MKMIGAHWNPRRQRVVLIGFGLGFALLALARMGWASGTEAALMASAGGPTHAQAGAALDHRADRRACEGVCRPLPILI